MSLEYLVGSIYAVSVTIRKLYIVRYILWYCTADIYLCRKNTNRVKNNNNIMGLIIILDISSDRANGIPQGRWEKRMK